MNERLEGTLGCAAAILFMGFGLLQIAAGWLGIEEAFGFGWAVGAILLALVFRFTVPIVIGAYLCAVNIWGWHWAFGALFAAPGLLFMVPALIAALAEATKR